MISPDLCSTLRVEDPDPSHVRYFQINDQLLRAALPNRNILDSLGSFFYPFIENHDGTYKTDQFYELTTIIDPKLFDSLKTNLPDSPDDLLTTNLKHDLDYQLRCFFSESGEVTIIEDEPLKLLYVICGDQRGTKIVATAESRIRTGLLRIIRGAWMNAHPGVIVHSSVVEKHGRGIVMAGDKYSGKTTSLLKLCTQKHYNLVANDRCVLQFDESHGLRALGVPTVINLRPETLKPFPDLQHLKTLDLLGPYDLAQALRIKVKADVEVTSLVFLGYDRACRKAVYRRLSNEEKTEKLSSYLFSRREYDWVKLLNIGAVPANTGNLAKTIPLSSVSAFELTSNETQLDERADLLDSWLEEPRTA